MLVHCQKSRLDANFVVQGGGTVQAGNPFLSAS
jgi:hypothetical protein